MAREAAEEILSLFYPRRCPVCQDIVTPRGEKICPECRRRITFIEEPVCRKCGREIPYPEEEYCDTCRQYPRSFEAGISLMRYDRVGQASMQGFKYHGRPEYGAYYMEEMAARHGAWIRSRRADALIPVPIHKSRRRQRGYNQAEVLAKELSRLTGIPALPTVLIRTKKTVAQKKLGGRERQLNLQRAMEVKNLPADVRRVILIDDIYTTGSTAEACTRVLKAAGVEAVFVLTVCMVGE